MLFRLKYFESQASLFLHENGKTKDRRKVKMKTIQNATSHLGNRKRITGKVKIINLRAENPYDY